MFKRIMILGALSFSLFSVATDVPGGIMRTGQQLSDNTYEMLLSPAYLITSPAAYLTSELRYQAAEDLGMAFSFGAGEVGFNFGMNGIWYAMPRGEEELSFAVLGGVYFNRISPANYFVLRLNPVLSQLYATAWGSLTPYVGAHLSPCFSLSQITGDNRLSVRASAGAEFALHEFGGLKVWTEAGVNIASSQNEIVVGISYPFTAL